MYLRKIKRHKDGKTHAYWALVESYRTERGPRQRTVAYLGEMDQSGWLSFQMSADRIWVMDRGMVSQENMTFLKQNNRHYIIGTPKSLLKKFEQQLLSQNWQTVHDGLEVQSCQSPDGDNERFLLCRSSAQKEKEQTILNRFTQHIEAGLLVYLKFRVSPPKIANLLFPGRKKKIEPPGLNCLRDVTCCAPILTTGPANNSGKLIFTWLMLKQHFASRKVIWCYDQSGIRNRIVLLLISLSVS